jgi:hypothetical protein
VNNPRPAAILNGNATFDVVNGPSANTALTINGGITTNPANSAFGITKTGNGSLILADIPLFAANNNITVLNVPSAYNGPTKIVQGTLELAASDRIPNTSSLQMAGGTFHTAGFNETLASLQTMATSTIDLGTTSLATDTLQAGDSSGLHWTNGATLHVANWSGSTSGGGTDQILFPGVNSLNPNQLNQIVFDGSGFTHAQLIAVGGGVELVPTNTAPANVLLVGDVNQDTHVNVADISALMAALSDLTTYTNNLPLLAGWSSKAAEAIYLADVNYDDRITNTDIQALINHLANGGGSGSGSLTAVPEPASCALLALGGLMMGALQYRRRATSRRQSS